MQPPRPLVARVRRVIVERQLVRQGDHVLAAVSGGADSTCLLLILAALRRSLRLDLQAAYFDHMLRGRRAIEREQRLLRTLCDQLCVPLHVGSGDVRAHMAKERLSLEEAARDLRYDYLAQTARANGCAAVATGHTEDDQAETVLLHIIRGAGLGGLAAMAPSSRLPVKTEGESPLLIRPLLSLRRADTERCCREAGIEPAEDATNRSRARMRNRVRHELLPLLRQYNPRIEQALVRLAIAAAADAATIDQLAAEALADAKKIGGTLRISRRRLGELPVGLQPSVVRAALERLLGSARAFSEQNVMSIVRAASGRTGTALDLPRGLGVEVQRDALVLRVGQGALTGPLRRVRLAVPGTARFGLWAVQAELLEAPTTRLRPAKGVLAALFDADALGSALWLRGRRPGDRYQPLGMGRTRKLQDVLVDAHVPRGERDALPLVCAGRRIAWVVGEAPAEWAKITPKTKHAVRIRAERADA